MDINEITIIGGYNKFGEPEAVRELTVKKGNIAYDEVISLETLRRGLRGDTFGKIQ